MRKLIAIFFLAVFSFSFTEMRQFLKVPYLVQHYHDHVARGDKSFAGFLRQHYLINHKDDGDKEKDNNLPFKSTEVNTTTSVTFHTPIEGIQPQRPVIARVFLYNPSSILTEHCFSVFHPPRIG
jgi:hypothetical protein